MKTVAELLQMGTATLNRAGVSSARSDARRLLAHVLGLDPVRLSSLSLQGVPESLGATYLPMIGERAMRVPVSHIVGYRDFWSHRYRVTGDVLDPRPETELLIEHALCRPFSRVLDLGTGSGAILLTLLLEMPDATGVGTDISTAALEVANGNPILPKKAMHDALAARREFLISDWFEGVSGLFDLIVSNPPYISLSEMDGLQPEVRDNEPHVALTDGADGLQAYRTICANVYDYLEPGGRLIVEIGPTQAAVVCGLFEQAGLQKIEVHKDLDDRERAITGMRPQ